MTPAIELAKAVPAEAEALGVPVASDVLSADRIPEAFLVPQGFEGKPGQTAVVPVLDGPDLIAVGVGPTAEVDAGVIRQAAAALSRAANRRHAVASQLLLAVPDADDRPAAAQAHAEGTCLGAYRYRRFKTDSGPSGIERMVVVSPGGKRVDAALALGARIAEGVATARDLVNEPGGSLTPRALAEAAVEIADREGLQITVLDEHQIAEARMGGLLGVNRGSAEPPRFIQLCYEPPQPRGTLALVGKGITFDSGGLSIKSADSMMTMKDDMGGAAAVLGAFSVIGAVAPRCRVVGYIPATDNMSGSDATRPGDVLEIRNGKTVEVLNTDAEGRLVLADALSLASEHEPDAIVDLATLTGAIGVALGSRIAGLMSNDDAWRDQVQGAADGVGERVWPLPLPPDYHSRIESDVADLRNVAKSRDGGSLIAGLFLQDFVGDGIPWAHLDIAGTAWWGDADDGEHARGATGFGVRLLLELARTFRPPRR